MAAPKKKLTKANALANAQAKVDAARRELADIEESLPKKAGKPTAYRPEYAARATGLCMLGYTNEEMAESFAVDIKTIEHWLAMVPEFAGAVYAGRDGADIEVIGALFKSAKGYEHDEDDIRVVSLGNNGGSQIEITQTIKRYPPNVAAVNLILANRQKRRWANNAVSGSVANPNGSTDDTPESLALKTQAAIRAALDDTADPLKKDGT